MKREYNILGQTVKLTDSEFNKIAIRSYNDMIRAKDTPDEAVERIAEKYALIMMPISPTGKTVRNNMGSPVSGSVSAIFCAPR